MNAIDTNVLIYFYDERDPAKQLAATSLIKSLQNGVLLWQVACEFIAATRRLSQNGLTCDVGWKRLQELRELFPLIVPSTNVLDRARALMNAGQLHFWDAMIYAACIEADIDRLYTEDVPGSKIAGMEIINPFAKA